MASELKQIIAEVIADFASRGEEFSVLAVRRAIERKPGYEGEWPCRVIEREYGARVTHPGGWARVWEFPHVNENGAPVPAPIEREAA